MLQGSTRAFPPHHPLIPVDYQLTGQPVLIGGTMGTCSYVLTGTETGMLETFGSTCHGAVSESFCDLVSVNCLFFFPKQRFMRKQPQTNPNFSNSAYFSLSSHRVGRCRGQSPDVTSTTRTCCASWSIWASRSGWRRRN